MSNIWLTSDTHYYHSNEHSNRPFSSVEDMNEKMIENHNKLVKPNDTIYHLGDFGFGTAEQNIKIAKRLNGNKCLVFGNHDKHMKKDKDFMSHFGWGKDYFELRNDNTKIVLCHYPFESWNTSGHGSIHCHGHTHNNLHHNNKKRIDVGVDAVNYSPISLEEIFEIMKTRGNSPHH